MRKRINFVSISLHILAFALSVIPAALCTLLYFPIWSTEGARSASGIGALLLVFSFIPICKGLKRLLSSPSVTTLWLIIFVLFFALSRIAEEMTVVSFVGFLSNLIASAVFKIAGRIGCTSEGRRA